MYKIRHKFLRLPHVNRSQDSPSQLFTPVSLRAPCPSSIRCQPPCFSSRQNFYYILNLIDLISWYINAGIFEPAWDRDEQKLVWNECSTTVIHLLSIIKTVGEVQELPERIYSSEHGFSLYFPLA